MKTIIKILPLIMLLFAFVACQSDTSNQQANNADNTNAVNNSNSSNNNNNRASNGNDATNNKTANGQNRSANNKNAKDRQTNSKSAKATNMANKQFTTKQKYERLDIPSAKIKANRSQVYWTGTKPIGDAHKGSFQVKSGVITFANGEMNGGDFVLDMAGVKVSDIKEKGPNAKLVGHLKSADFFDTAKYPEARFKITKVELAKDVEGAVGGFSHFITGDLSLKDVTQSVRFGVNVFTKGNSFQVRSRAFNIDRTQWNVKYNSGKFFNGIKDKLIDDKVAIKIDVLATY